MRARIRLPIIGLILAARSFFSHPLRFVGRRLFRFGINLGIFGLSFGRGGLRFIIRIWPFSLILGGRRGKKGGGSGKKGGGSSKTGSGGGEHRESSGGGEPRESDGERESRGERLSRAVSGRIDALRAARERSRQRERDERERPERERQERERQERERQERETRDREERDRQERDRQERDRQEREKQERERQERATRDREERERQERETRDREERDRQERDSQERKQKERERQERVERKARDEPRPTSDAELPGFGPLASRSTSEFRLGAPLPLQQRVLLEASAGTGKTFSLTSLVARYVAEHDLAVEELLMVTFTKAAAAEMRERTRATLSQALEALQSGASRDDMGGDAEWLWPIADAGPDERNVRMKRLRTAVTSIDAATITTIHGFFQQTLREVGLRSSNTLSADISPDDPNLARQVLRDELVQLYSAGDKSLAAALPDKSPADVEKRVTEILRALDANISAVAAPDVDCDPVARRWSTFVTEVKRRTKERRVGAGTLSFDDLVTLMRELLDEKNPMSAEVVSGLRARYRLVLIDEFQDTDDTQWEIFSRIFSTEFVRGADGGSRATRPFLAMVLVGDPKQAIYRFRGADISAYLGVATQSDLVRYDMTTNFRSDRDLITALNRLFSDRTAENGEPIGFKFGSPHIEFVQVKAARKGAGSGLSLSSDPNAAKALQLRWLPTDAKPTPTVAVIRPLIAEDVTNHIVRLLNEGSIAESKNGVTVERRVLPGDISILVRNHGDANPLVEALRGRGIPVVKSSIGSVTESPAVDQLRLLFAALAAPADSRKVRAFALGWFVNFPPERLLVEKDVTDLSVRCSDWAGVLIERGVVGFFQMLRADGEVITQLSSSVEAERRLTDLEHLVELLHRRIGPKPLSAAGVLRQLDDMVRGATETDENLRRIESDADAIQITTMHASKGLEYPIVLVPYPKAPQTRGPDVYTHAGRRFVDAAPDVPWEHGGLDPDVRAGLARREINGDELRIMYVAFTRAKHQLAVWWANSKGMNASPLARLLFGDYEDIDVATKVPDAAGVRASLDRIVERVGGDLVEVRELSLSGVVPLALSSPTVEVAGSGQFARFPATATGRPHVRRWSYSGIVAGFPDDHADSTKGGTDETHDAEADDAPAPTEESVAGAYTNDGLFPMPASAAFGTLVHELLEVVDFTSPTLRDDLLVEIERRGLSMLSGVDPDALATGLVRAVDTPLEPLFPGVRLADIAAGDRLAEMDFHFALPKAVESVEIARVAAADEGSLFAPYFADLADRWSARGGPGTRMGGLMTGSLDAVLRHGGNGVSRFAVVDYKSNRLSHAGDPLDVRAYGHEAMVMAMIGHHYPLQALIYCVALHRFLLSRLDGYDIDTHLVGAGYLFVRGMTGPDSPRVDGRRNGVFLWRPSSATVLAVDSLLGGGS